MIILFMGISVITTSTTRGADAVPIKVHPQAVAGFSPDSRQLAILESHKLSIRNLDGTESAAVELDVSDEGFDEPQLLWSADSSAVTFKDRTGVVQQYHLQDRTTQSYHSELVTPFAQSRLVRAPTPTGFCQLMSTYQLPIFSAKNPEPLPLPIAACAIHFDGDRSTQLFTPKWDGLFSGAYSGDGKLFVGGGVTGQIYCWKLSSGELLSSRETAQKLNLAVSGHGDEFVSGGMDGRVRFWQGPALKELRTFDFPSWASGYSTGGNLIGIGWLGGVAIVDRRTWTHRQLYETDYLCTQLEWLQGDLLSVQGQHGWVVLTDKLEKVFETKDGEECLAVSKDARWCVILTDRTEDGASVQVVRLPVRGP